MVPTRNPVADYARRHQCGQALTEAVLAVGAASLLAALLVMVGKYHLIALAASGASHALAFECAMLPDLCRGTTAPTDSVHRLREHHFTNATPGLRQSMPWTNRDGRAFLQAATQDVDFTLEQLHFGAGIGALSAGARSAAGSAVHVVSNLAGPGRFDLDISGGLIKTRTDLNIFADRLGQPPDLLAGLAVKIHRESAILSDLWNASEPYGHAPHTVQSRVARGQQLANWIETAHRAGYAPTRGFIRLMGAISLEDSADQFAFHETDVDTIPSDRIGQ